MSDRPGARFISWVADDDERVEQVLAFGREHGFPGSLARWSEDQIRAARAYMQALRRPAPVESVTTSTPLPESATTPDPASFGIRSGRDFYFWLKDRSSEHGIALLDYVQDWAKSQGWPSWISKWDLIQVARGLEVAQAKLAEVVAPPPEAPVESVTTPPVPDPDLAWWRKNLQEHVLQVIALRYPGRKVTGPLIAEALALLTQLDPQGRRLSNISFCDDRQLLADFTELATRQLIRLTATQTPSLLPAEAPAPVSEPSLFGPDEEAAA